MGKTVENLMKVLSPNGREAAKNSWCNLCFARGVLLVSLAAQRMAKRHALFDGWDSVSCEWLQMFVESLVLLKVMFLCFALYKSAFDDEFILFWGFLGKS